MPTDASITDAEIAQPPKENHNHGLRLALTPWAVFVIGMIGEIPMAFLSAVFAALFTLGLKPLPPVYGWALLRKSALIMLLAWGLSVLLLPYPIVYLIFICLGVMLSYRLQLKTNDLLLSVFALIAALLVPYLTRNSPDLSGQIAFWLMAHLLIAMVASWIAFALFPEPETDTPKPAAAPVQTHSASRRMWRLAIVTIPFVIVAFVFDFITPFVLVFVAIQTTQIVANTSAHGGASQMMLIANAIGGVAAIVVYELMIMAPILLFAALAILAAMLWFSGRFVSGDVRMVSGITAFLILLGGTLMPFSDDAQTKMIFRLWQIGLALLYLGIAFKLVDSVLPEKEEN